jgi:hypothetical protein
VVAGILGSAEYLLDEANALYLSELNRPGDPVGLNFFTMALARGEPLEQVKALILASDEFFADSQADKQATANESYVDNLFLHLQGKSADANSLSSLAGQLDHGTPRSAVVAQIAALSDSLNFLVDSYFELYLHRHADAGGLSFFSNELQHGADDSTLVAGIVGSDEYFARVGP